ETIIYDNHPGYDDNTYSDIAISGGSIIVHKGNKKSNNKSVNSKANTDVESNDEIFEELNIISWPNPSNSLFNIKLETINSQDIVHIDVFDVTGKLVHSNTIKFGNKYSFGKNLESGLYIVKISHSNKQKLLRLVKY
ncbi:MAG TPA: T9SS type A sorting domain-containing protein, partial [Flavobacteriaceae bacterium]|nr:T9SS type A sorting domain-containing protein [Flavobacteriaceae bacterium]